MVAKKQKSASAPANETKEQRFVRLATARTGKVLKGITGIGKLTGSNYSYTSVQAAKIVDALKHAVTALEKKFSGSAEAGESFKL